MAFRAEPPYSHGQAERTAILLVNLGTPQAPTASALRKYLAEFLSDPRVVEIPRMVWLPILYGPILTFRPSKSAAKYKTVWTPEGSPLAVHTQRQAKALQAKLDAQGHGVLVAHAMRYGQPSVASQLDALRARGASRILVLPLYPQYAAATTASVWDAVCQWAQKARRVPELRLLGQYHDDAGYIAALAQSVRSHWQANGRGERLLLSFHGVPERSLHLGDPYHCHCYKTGRLLAQALELQPEQVFVSFQSRFGKAKWLEPYTEPTLVAWAKAGVKSVDVLCPGFAADCLETLEEISQEASTAFLKAGGQGFSYIPCLNDQPQWIEALAELSLKHLQAWPTHTAAQMQEQQALRAQQLVLAKALGSTT